MSGLKLRCLEKRGSNDRNGVSTGADTGGKGWLGSECEGFEQYHGTGAHGGELQARDVGYRHRGGNHGYSEIPRLTHICGDESEDSGGLNADPWRITNWRGGRKAWGYKEGRAREVPAWLVDFGVVESESVRALRWRERWAFSNAAEMFGKVKTGNFWLSLAICPQWSCQELLEKHGGDGSQRAGGEKRRQRKRECVQRLRFQDSWIKKRKQIGK